MFQDEKKFGEAQVELQPWQRVLLDAADLLERDGWCQHRTRDDCGRYCALGAVQLVGHYSPFFKLVFDDFRIAERVLYSVVGPIPAWNDQPGRTREEVCAALRQAAAS